MLTKTLEELTRGQLWEELRVWNQPPGRSKEQIQQRLTSCLEEEGWYPGTEIFDMEDARSTMDPLAQILEELAEVGIKVEQHGHLAILSTKVDQQQEHMVAISTKTDQQLTAISAKADQQHAEIEQHSPSRWTNNKQTSRPYSVWQFLRIVIRLFLIRTGCEWQRKLKFGRIHKICGQIFFFFLNNMSVSGQISLTNGSQSFADRFQKRYSFFSFVK